MKIAFLGTRGIPNNYGGFEQFAEFISVGLVNKGHEIVVYSPHFHLYKKKEYKGVKIKRIYSPERWLGSGLGSIVYDFLCLRDALKNENFDIIYEAGYTSVVPSYIWFNIKKIVSPIFVTNMDGLEYKRSKFNKIIQRFVFWEEKMAVQYSHYLISDNMGIKDYYKEKYNKRSDFLAYGANVYDDYSEKYLTKYRLKSRSYYLVIARMEPENNIEMIIDGYLNSSERENKPLVLIGNLTTPFAKYITKKYIGISGLVFLGGIYDFKEINSLRYYSYGYFHGHSVGGTNPSLLEAMASSCLILAHNNIFNRTVLNENALYFSSEEEISSILNNQVVQITAERMLFINNNLKVIRETYSWEKLINQHEKYFEGLCNNS